MNQLETALKHRLNLRQAITLVNYDENNPPTMTTIAKWCDMSTANVTGMIDRMERKGVIERAIELWSNEGDLVYSPFTGIGSEGVGALSLNRRFVGSELKESYFNQACENLKNAKAQLTLF